MAGACAKDGLVACSFNWLALWSAVPLHLRLFRAGRCFLFGFSPVWGRLRSRAFVGPFGTKNKSCVRADRATWIAEMRENLAATFTMTVLIFRIHKMFRSTPCTTTFVLHGCYGEQGMTDAFISYLEIGDAYQI